VPSGISARLIPAGSSTTSSSPNAYAERAAGQTRLARSVKRVYALSMSRVRSAWIAIEVPALLAGLALTGCFVAAGLAYLWVRVGGNVAGWATVFVAFGGGFLIGDVIGVSDAFIHASARARQVLIGVGLVVAAAGSVGYALWPGTGTWYLSTVPAVPIVLMIGWLTKLDGNDDATSASEFTDGPWSAP
jgi:hypothetical protein